ncbi:MAG: YkgJ family cysteine cluster protein [Nitrospirota bacterium]
MSTRKLKRSGYRQPRRPSFPSDEKIHPWLSLLLDAYHIIDKGIAEAIKMESTKSREVACRKGCANCCNTHRDIPVYPLELVGLSWYATEKISNPLRDRLKRQLRDYKENDPCPFLIEKACSIHPLRPVSCRQFIVFNKGCTEGEDPYYTRREDVLTPIKNYVDKAFFIMLPFYGVTDESLRWRIIERSSLHMTVKLIQTCNWRSLAERMEEFEQTREV